MTALEIMRLVRNANRQRLEEVVAEIALSALDDNESGDDTAAVVYEQLAKLGIIVT